MRIEIDRVEKVFVGRRGQPPVHALDGVSFRVEAGEFVAVLGPSGCGKSTLLSIIAGLLDPTGGEVRFVQERPRPEGRTTDALTAVVFQEFALFPWRTVLDNVAFGLEVRGIERSVREEVARRYLRMVGLGEFEGKFPRELSGGMKQRVGIARALAVEPSVLLMDEPLSALDAQTRTLLQNDLLRIWEQTQQTVLYVTHNISEAAFLADRIVLLRRRPGRVHRIVNVPFPRPRTEELQATAEFGSFVQEVWEMIRDEALEALSEEAGP